MVAGTCRYSGVGFQDLLGDISDIGHLAHSRQYWLGRQGTTLRFFDNQLRSSAADPDSAPSATTDIDTRDVTSALDEKLAAATRQIVVGWSALSVDIEANPADGDRIFKIGAVRSDNDDVVSLSTGRFVRADVVRRMNAASTGAKLLVGHNLRRHDVPQLRRQYPGLACLDLPILDTLELSAIAFPSNPYHRLVKGYKLISDSRNDPVKDARLALVLVSEEIDALVDMHGIDPEWVALLHFLLRGDGPLAYLLSTIRTAGAPEPAEATEVAVRRFGPLCCGTRLSQFGALDVEGGAEHSMALAYALGWIRVSGGNSVLPIWVHNAIPAVR